MIDWNKPIETVPCERNPDPVPCEFAGFDGDESAKVFIRGDWVSEGGTNRRDDADEHIPWFYDVSGHDDGYYLPYLRNVASGVSDLETANQIICDLLEHAVYDEARNDECIDAVERARAFIGVKP